jgi:hypothetical protein
VRYEQAAIGNGAWQILHSSVHLFKLGISLKSLNNFGILKFVYFQQNLTDRKTKVRVVKRPVWVPKAINI